MTQKGHTPTTENRTAALLYMIQLTRDARGNCTTSLLMDTVYIVQVMTRIKIRFRFKAGRIPESKQLCVYIRRMSKEHQIDRNQNTSVLTAYYNDDLVLTAKGHAYQDQHLHIPKDTAIRIGRIIRTLAKKRVDDIEKFSVALSLVDAVDYTTSIWDRMELLKEKLDYVRGDAIGFGVTATMKEAYNSLCLSITANSKD